MKKKHELEVKLNITELWKTNHQRTNVVLWYMWTVPMIMTNITWKCRGTTHLSSGVTDFRVVNYLYISFQVCRPVNTCGALMAIVCPTYSLSSCGSRTILCHHCCVTTITEASKTCKTCSHRPSSLVRKASDGIKSNVCSFTVSIMTQN